MLQIVDSEIKWKRERKRINRRERERQRGSEINRVFHRKSIGKSTDDTEMIGNGLSSFVTQTLSATVLSFEI